jgi:hypothetical protein
VQCILKWLAAPISSVRHAEGDVFPSAEDPKLRPEKPARVGRRQARHRRDVVGKRQSRERALAHYHRMHEFHRNMLGIRSGGAEAEGNEPSAPNEAPGHHMTQLGDPLGLRLEEGAYNRLSLLVCRPNERGL